MDKSARKLGTAFPKYKTDFETKWSAWRNATSTSSDPSTWSAVPEFRPLIALGPKIVPLVLAKMDGSDAAAGVFLSYRIEADDLDITAQVDKIRHKNFIRNRAIRNALLDWDEHSGRMGVCIIPQLMLRYEKLRHGADGLQPIFGYEALHEVIWGYPCEFEQVSLKAECKEWVQWFENEDHIQAPHFKRKQDRRPQFPPLSDEEDSD
ncbi:hypothetical protein QBC35DRAFT_548358 [Podospora australis]|uniref:Uncharacterized protein n=1 Tax=Podospora australis TaxID=1536484 RepID=A0AAN6WL26_9PEZI|nr:hypothetical protein QBC35DRAFT_548358 [Podospora australis]